MDRRMMEKSRCMMVKEMSRPGVACMCVQVFSLFRAKKKTHNANAQTKKHAHVLRNAQRACCKKMEQKGEWHKKENGAKRRMAQKTKTKTTKQKKTLSSRRLGREEKHVSTPEHQESLGAPRKHC